MNVLDGLEVRLNWQVKEQVYGLINELQILKKEQEKVAEEKDRVEAVILDHTARTQNFLLDKVTRLEEELLRGN